MYIYLKAIGGKIVQLPHSCMHLFFHIKWDTQQAHRIVTDTSAEKSLLVKIKKESEVTYKKQKIE